MLISQWNVQKEEKINYQWNIFTTDSQQLTTYNDVFCALNLSQNEHLTLSHDMDGNRLRKYIYRYTHTSTTSTNKQYRFVFLPFFEKYVGIDGWRARNTLRVNGQMYSNDIVPVISQTKLKNRLFPHPNCWMLDLDLSQLLLFVFAGQNFTQCHILAQWHPNGHNFTFTPGKHGYAHNMMKAEAENN